MSEMDDLIPEILAETADLIEKVYQDLPGLSAGENVDALLDGVFRSIHTIKGGSGMFNFKNTLAVSHALETFLSELKSKQPLKISENDTLFILTETQKIEKLLKNQDQFPVSQETPQLNRAE